MNTKKPKKRKPYARIKKKEYKASIARNDGMHTALLMLADNAQANAMAQAGGKPYEPSVHDMGWTIAIPTAYGPVGLWSTWLGTQFHLTYPKPRQFPDRRIAEVLGVEPAKEVLQVDCLSTHTTDTRHDADKPPEPCKAGGYLVYETRGPRKWAEFYGPATPGKIGRVWVGHVGEYMYGSTLEIIDSEKQRIVKTQTGHDHSMSIHTYPFTHANKYALDSPTSNHEEIQKYRDKFLELLVEVAFFCGVSKKPEATITYGTFLMVPEQLQAMGYELTWKQGRMGQREFGDNVFASKGDENVILTAANSLVPWVCHRQKALTELDKKSLLELLKF